MAARSSSAPLLIFGVILLIQHLTPLKAELPKVGIEVENLNLNPEEADNDSNDNAYHELETRSMFFFGGFDFGSFIDSVVNGFGKDGKAVHGDDADGEDGHDCQVGHDGDSGFRSSVVVSRKSGEAGYGVIEWNIGNLKMRAFTVGRNGINMINNQIRVGNNVLVADTRKAAGTPTYQKTCDGSRFHTNAKVGGVLMTKAEIDQFEADWAQHKKEAAERQRKHKEEMDALQRRLKREAEERQKEQAERQREQTERQRERQREQEERQRERQRGQEERQRERQREQAERQRERQREQEERQREQEERQRERQREQAERQREQAERQRERQSRSSRGWSWGW